jgi:hypothetical protein
MRLGLSPTSWRSPARVHWRRLAATLLTATACLALGACRPAPEPPPSVSLPMTLHPFGPRSTAFDAPQGRAHNDYLFVDQPRRGDPAWRATLKSALTAWPEPAGGPWALRSVFVYEHNERIGPQFQGDADALRGVHDQDLVAYTRWTAGKLETAWVIDQGNVVFDLLLDQPVRPPFEFD